MSPNPLALGGVRPAAVVNEEIRALMANAGGRLYGDARVEYERLRDEWVQATAAERIDVVTAA